MAIKNIIINDYTVPAGVNGEAVITTALKFLDNTCIKYAAKYIGTEKNCSREVVKRIATDVDGVSYTVRFNIKKTSTEAMVICEFIAHDIDIVLSDQAYTTLSSFNTDMEYIKDAITNTFRA